MKQTQNYFIGFVSTNPSELVSIAWIWEEGTKDNVLST